MPPRLWFRVDASKKIGAGHFMRCLALAERWRDEGGAATFIGSFPSELAQRLIDEGIEQTSPGAVWPHRSDLAETQRLIPPEAVVVVDGYNFDAEYHQGIGASRRRVMVIDDIGHLPAYAGELLLNFNLGAERVSYDRAPSHRLLGPSYVPLRRRFSEVDRSAREIPPTATKLLVTLGGADPTGATPRVMTALSRPAFQGASIRVVAGPASINLPELRRIADASDGRFELLSDVGDMPELMAWADFAISAAGGTGWELAFMGLPSGLIAVAENQRPNVAGLVARDVAVELGAHESTDELAARIGAVVSDPQARRRMGELGRELFDGLGATRVIQALRQLSDGLFPNPGQG